MRNQHALGRKESLTGRGDSNSKAQSQEMPQTPHVSVTLEGITC